MSARFQPVKDKPKGIYKTAYAENSCKTCAYRNGYKCNVRNQTLPARLSKFKCADYLYEESFIPDFKP